MRITILFTFKITCLVLLLSVTNPWVHASSGSTPDIVVVGNAGAGDATIFDWYNDIIQQLMLMQQRQAAAHAEYMRAQQHYARRAQQAQQAYGECMGYAGSRENQCKREAAKGNADNVVACGDIPGDGVTVSVQLTFGVVSMSGALDGSARVAHCKDIAAAYYEQRQAECASVVAEQRLICAKNY